MLHVGLDVGSTTAKMVAVDRAGNIVYQSYRRHLSDVKSTVLGLLSDIRRRFPAVSVTMNISGSAGLSLAKHIDFPFIQEVIACTQAVERFIPETDVVIELGGEDAKIIYFRGGIEQRMNSACAGGTGAFIDQIASLLQTDAEGLNKLASVHETIYPIASRCGVFAKTDVQPLLNEGARKEDIAASIFQSVVNQTISGLACGRPIRGKVAFLGGPLTFLSGLRERFIETLGLTEEETIFPEHAQYFVAIGSAFNSASAYLNDKEAAVQLDDIFRQVNRLDFKASSARENDPLPPLFEGAADLDAFRQRHRQASALRGSLASYRGPCYLGIDAGSTTTKIVLIGQNDEILYTFYGSNQGNPLQSVINGMKDLYREIPLEAMIVRSAVTGYGEGLIKAALKIDTGEIETVAHYKAAVKFRPDVDFILDIGGQDM
ncbi:MAG: 2-hydroxyglutaryl-CoA dehydratase, partial [Gorillibacterium sp.]|nr:2-hydroxyglutaryl-CoA dehydratase [Gorillibacterium sp.]